MRKELPTNMLGVLLLGVALYAGIDNDPAVSAGFAIMGLKYITKRNKNNTWVK